VQLGFRELRHQLVQLRRQPAAFSAVSAAESGGGGTTAASAIVDMVQSLEKRLGRLEVHVTSERQAARRRVAELVGGPNAHVPAC
jgi:CHASE3 domain sensor protein